MGSWTAYRKEDHWNLSPGRARKEGYADQEIRKHRWPRSARKVTNGKTDGKRTLHNELFSKEGLVEGGIDPTVVTVPSTRRSIAKCLPDERDLSLLRLFGDRSLGTKSSACHNERWEEGVRCTATPGPHSPLSPAGQRSSLPSISPLPSYYGATAS